MYTTYRHGGSTEKIIKYWCKGQLPMLSYWRQEAIAHVTWCKDENIIHVYLKAKLNMTKNWLVKFKLSSNGQVAITPAANIRLSRYKLPSEST